MRALRLDPDCLALFNSAPCIAIAVSGGADSMALAHGLRDHYPDKQLWAYTVDHGLRDNSATEAQQVHEWLRPHMSHRLLTWDGDKRPTGLQESARRARYDLLMRACAEDGAPFLCTAHHGDDQAETILHRLAKGSGLDGLVGMHPVSSLNDEVTLCRPLLSLFHADLVAYCQTHAIAWIEDPSNDNTQFARVRLRQARAVLEQEGLSNERLIRLGARFSRARAALEFYTHQAVSEYCSINNIAADARRDVPPEILLRLVLRMSDRICPHHALRSRLSQLEELLDDITPRRVTLGHTILTFREDGGIIIEAESTG